MDKTRNNFAFIDSQNLNLGVRELGWLLDFKRFRVYLAEKYGVRKAARERLDFLNTFKQKLGYQNEKAPL